MPETMPDKEFQSEKQYLTAASLAESMLKAELITQNERTIIDTILLEKFRPSLSTLLSGKSLQSKE